MLLTPRRGDMKGFSGAFLLILVKSGRGVPDWRPSYPNALTFEPLA